jgi:hypothetical protein
MSANMNFDKEIAAHRSNEVTNRGTRSQVLAVDLPDASVNTANSGRFVTPLDRWIARKMMAVVGDPPVVLKLWDGIEVTPPQSAPVARLQYHSRGAMFKTILNPEPGQGQG